MLRAEVDRRLKDSPAVAAGSAPSRQDHARPCRGRRSSQRNAPGPERPSDRAAAAELFFGRIGTGSWFSMKYNWCPSSLLRCGPRSMPTVEPGGSCAGITSATSSPVWRIARRQGILRNSRPCRYRLPINGLADLQALAAWRLSAQLSRPQRRGFVRMASGLHSNLPATRPARPGCACRRNAAPVLADAGPSAGCDVQRLATRDVAGKRLTQHGNEIPRRHPTR